MPSITLQRLSRQHSADEPDLLTKAARVQAPSQGSVLQVETYENCYSTE